MPKQLRMNTALIMSDYIDALSKALDEIAHGYFSSVISQMRTSQGAKGVSVEVEDGSKKLVRKVIGDAWAVMDSWGTGSLMDTSNDALSAYLSSNLYNPARQKTLGAPITGRPEGTYTDVFGEQQRSSGNMEGLNLEQIPDSPIKAQAPSGAFQDTDKWFVAEKTMQEVISKTTKQFFAGVSASQKYWRFG